MAKFRKKPIVIDAEQWFPGKEIDGVVELAPGAKTFARQEAYISTLEGNLYVTPGDWIITGVAGEKYACKPEIFSATYEPAVDVETPALPLDIFERTR